MNCALIYSVCIDLDLFHFLVMIDQALAITNICAQGAGVNLNVTAQSRQSCARAQFCNLFCFC